MLWTTLDQSVWQLGWNGQVPWKIQMTKTDSRRYRKSKYTYIE